MTNIDIVFGILLLVFIIWGMLKGIIWTIVRLGSFIGVILVISNFKDGFRYKLSEIINVSPAIATVILYIAVFFVMMFLGKLVYDLLIKLVKKLKLGCLNRAAGGLLSGASYVLLLAMIVILLDLSPLSINGRGVRPGNHRSEFETITRSLEEEINNLKEEMPELEIDLVWEALDNAGKKFEKATSKPEKETAITDLYKSLQSNLQEKDFNRISEKLRMKRNEQAKFSGKELTLPSIFLQEVIEPIADYLEIKFMGIKV